MLHWLQSFLLTVLASLAPHEICVEVVKVLFVDAVYLVLLVLQNWLQPSCRHLDMHITGALLGLLLVNHRSFVVVVLRMAIHVGTIDKRPVGSEACSETEIGRLCRRRKISQQT